MDTTIVGIDVAKDRLDVAVRPSGELFVVERNASGLELLVERLIPGHEMIDSCCSAAIPRSLEA
jgi:transposase